MTACKAKHEARIALISIRLLNPLLTEYDSTIMELNQKISHYKVSSAVIMSHTHTLHTSMLSTVRV